MEDFIFDNFGWVLFALIVVCFAGLIAGAKDGADARHAFMEQFTKDHKEYECVAAWRAGEKHDQVVPVFIPIR